MGLFAHKCIVANWAKCIFNFSSFSIIFFCPILPCSFLFYRYIYFAKDNSGERESRKRDWLVFLTKDSTFRKWFLQGKNIHYLTKFKNFVSVWTSQVLWSIPNDLVSGIDRNGHGVIVAIHHNRIQSCAGHNKIFLLRRISSVEFRSVISTLNNKF